MEITSELVKARIAQLEKEAGQLRNNLNACLGALQDCGYWLAQLEKQKSQDKK